MNFLFVSNGHGEDLNAGLIIDALRERSPSITLAALPLVGEGSAYQQRQIPIIAPVQPLPSGGLVYTSAMTWFRDIGGGLVSLTLKQIRSLRQQRQQFDLIVAVGDSVPLLFAYLSGRPYVSFLVANSSYYEGQLRLPFTMDWWLKSPRCLGAIAKDQLTAKDLQKRGINACCLGYPIMDALNPSGSLQKSDQNQPLIALLPGSRVPEALRNLAQLLPLCAALAQAKPLTFWIALVPAITTEHLQAIAVEHGWQYDHNQFTQGTCVINLSWHQFADILHQCDLVLGMAGTAVEQAVGLGKPVVQIPGYGPQFTYGFAEAQMRLLGCSVTTIGQSPDDPNLIALAVPKILAILSDLDYQDCCQKNGLERIGQPGASMAIADYLLEYSIWT
ncbi:MAG: lipid-A-disaccharide synthase-related protein [Synechocystis sp.]